MVAFGKIATYVGENDRKRKIGFVTKDGTIRRSGA